MYVVDANVFIQAANSYYAFDLVPKFWDWVENQVGVELFTVDPVKDEVLKQDGQLADWFRSMDDPNWVLAVDDEATQLQMPVISGHCIENNYKQAGIAKFLAGADPWVIAKAKVSDWIVVTQEIAQPETRKRVKIPDVCNSLNVENILVFDMLRKLGFSA
ncbi:MAG: DUF4411 family protein [Pseudomonadota bacterium]